MLSSCLFIDFFFKIEYSNSAVVFIYLFFVYFIYIFFTYYSVDTLL